MTKYIKITGPLYSQKRHRHTNRGFVYDPSAKDKKQIEEAKLIVFKHFLSNF